MKSIFGADRIVSSKSSLDRRHHGRSNFRLEAVSRIFRRNDHVVVVVFKVVNAGETELKNLTVLPVLR